MTHANGVEHAAFSGDGGWVVTASWDGTVRLWNATDGGPITPSIRLGSGVRHALLNTDGQVLVAASASAASVWHWAKEEQSLDDLDRMTSLLTGQGCDPQGRVVPLRREDIQQLWQTLRTKPAPAPEAVVQSWHRRALAQALEQRDASAVRFHVEHLLRHAPGEERLLELRAKLASNNGISADGAWTLTDLFAENRSHVPPRAAGTPDNLIDLSDFYDKPLTEAGHWDGPSELYNLSMLPRGVHTLAGMPFDLRGWVRLTGIPGAYAYAPERVSGISVGRRCRRLHFLHGTAYPKETGTQIANYVIHYADGQLHERPVIYGNDVQNFKWQSESELTEHPEAVRAWIGTNYLTAEMGYRYRLYKSVWENPRPDVTVATIDFRSRLVFSAPFLIAITAE